MGLGYNDIFEEEEVMDLFNRKEVARLNALVYNANERIRTIALDMKEVEENCARQIREVEHKLGLERKRHELEIEEAASHAVRDLEREMDRDRNAHTDEMIKTMRDYHQEIISRLPTVHVDRNIKQSKRTDPS